MSQIAEDLQRRLARKREGARNQALDTLTNTLLDAERARIAIEALEREGLIIERDECRPDHHHHTVPHKGCILR